MLDRLRFQEVEKVVFKAREKGRYGNKNLEKDEPFLIIDNAEMSRFRVKQRDKTSTSRSTEFSTSTIEGVSFNLSNGQVMLNLFESIFGTALPKKTTTFTINNVIQMEDTDTLELPSNPVGEVILYLTDDYGRIQKIAKTQYTISGNIITFIKSISHLITYVYQQEVPTQEGTSIKQLGAELILSLEMQCKAMDTLTEETIPLLIKFDKVSVGTSLSISFNNSSSNSESVIYVESLVEDLQNGVNKELFTIEVI